MSGRGRGEDRGERHEQDPGRDPRRDPEQDPEHDPETHLEAARCGAPAGEPVPGGSVFLQALGAAADRLHPEVRRYAAGAGVVGGAVAVEGEFEVAGSRFRKLNLLARPVVGPNLFVTAYERRVPFRVVNTVAWERGAGLGLAAERVFVFRAGEQRFADVLLPGPLPGTLRNLLGSARRVELELHCSVTEAGHLRLVSDRAWLRLGRVRLRLPALLSVRAEVVDGYDDVAKRNIVNARVRSPLMGTVLEYRGSFSHTQA